MGERLKLRESAYILKESDQVYTVVFTSSRMIRRFGVDQLVKDVISSLKETDSREDLMTRLSGYDVAQVNSCLLALEKFGLLIIDSGEHFNPRYKKQLDFIAEFSNTWEEAVNLQNKLEKSKVSVFGVGGIGTWIVNGLYQIGIGNIRITDPDVVSESNLNRQLFFTSQDVGKHKVEVIKEKLHDAKIVPYRKTVAENEDLEELVAGSDFLVNCTDNPSVADTTRILSRYARRHNIPYLVSGGYNMHLGMVGPIIVPGQTACFDCFLDHQKKNDSISHLEKIKDIEQTGSLGPIAGVVSNLQIMDIFKFLIGKGKVNFNRFAEINFMDFGVEWRDFAKRPECDCS